MDAAAESGAEEKEQQGEAEGANTDTPDQPGAEKPAETGAAKVIEVMVESAEESEGLPSTQEPSTEPAPDSTQDPSTEPMLDPSTLDPSVQPALDPSTEPIPDPSTQPTPEGGVTIDGIPVLQNIVEEEPEEVVLEENREELLEQIKVAFEERDRLSVLSSQVQHEIAEYLARKKVIDDHFIFIV